tara:strand:+ start:45 stop:662 length:618 start_codon:yes stop_codon:yes gene_type:complete
MDYSKIYNKIVNRAKNRKLTCYTEKHHILPKCIGGGDEIENIVELTAREHFLSHRLLCEMYPTEPKLFYALWLMAIGKNKFKNTEPYNTTSREYERIKLAFIEKRRGTNITDTHKKQIALKNSKKVIQYDFEGNILNQFSSANNGERFITNRPDAHWKELGNNIDACCRLLQKSAYGFIWKYEGDLLQLEQHIKKTRKGWRKQKQ